MLLVYMAEADLAEGDLPAARQHADQASTSAAKLGMKGNLAAALLSSARAAISAGDYGRAHDDAHQALTIAHGTQSKLSIIDAFECLAAVAPNADDLPKAARLLGAAHALRQETGYQRFRLRQNSYDIAVHALRSALGDQAFDQAWDEGAALALDDAVNYAQRGRGERGRPSIGWLSLTPAEREVVRLVAEGLANKDIAARLFVSPRTVQTHLTHIYDKLGLTSRVQLAQQAARQV
jgi:DNA-binding CsgD family transcriptional regulator